MSDVLRLLSHTDDAVCVIDEEQRIVLWNDAAELLFGHQARDVLGHPCAQFIRASDRHGCAICGSHCLPARLARADRVVATRELRVEVKSGESVFVSATTLVFPGRWRHTALLAHLLREVAGEARASPRSDARLPEGGPAPSFPSLPSTPASSGPLARLSARERQVLSLLATGADTDEIAERLFISAITVRNHVHRILAKLGAHSRLEAVSRALRTGLA